MPMTCQDLQPRVSAARQRLDDENQTHVLNFADRLGPDELTALLDDIDHIDWAELRPLLGRLADSDTPPPQDLQPVTALSATRIQDQPQLAAARARGAELIADGRVAALTVAGGQGTRLGHAGPKGTFAITPVSNKCLFEHFAEHLLAARARYDSNIPWFIMTSPENHHATASFFRARQFFGLPGDSIMLFMQGTMPAVDSSGRLLLSDRHRLAQAPDGHGGTLAALQRSGGLDVLTADNIAYVSYFQVDNPLVHPLDPTFIGLIDLAGSDVGSKAVRKTSPGEKVGVFARIDHAMHVVEYSDLPDDLAAATVEDGSLAYALGNMAVHVFRTAFLRRIVGAPNAGGLPWHVARKTVPFFDPATGSTTTPTAPNGIKFERFIFDTLPLAQDPLVYEVERAEQFSPVKNADGVDSPATARAHLIARAHRWLSAAGIEIAPDRVVEISPLFASDEQELICRASDIRIPPTGDVLLG